MFYNSKNWYWSGPLGIFSSALNQLVPATDQVYLAWLEQGYLATPWPKDIITGEQTAAALDVVLISAGLPATGLTPLTVEQLLVYASEAQNNALAEVFTFNVAAAGDPVHHVTTKLDAGGSQSMWEIGLGVLTNLSTTPPPVFPYSNVDFTSTTLTMAEATSLTAQAGILKLGTYAILNEIAARIKATPPTLTTVAEIDAYTWVA